MAIRSLKLNRFPRAVRDRQPLPKAALLTLLTLLLAAGALAQSVPLGRRDPATAPQIGAAESPEALLRRAQAEPDKNKAEALYRAALAKYPSNGDLMVRLGEFLAEKKQAFDEAEKLLKAAYEADPENPARLHAY